MNIFIYIYIYIYILLLMYIYVSIFVFFLLKHMCLHDFLACTSLGEVVPAATGAFFFGNDVPGIL